MKQNLFAFQTAFRLTYGTRKCKNRNYLISTIWVLSFYYNIYTLGNSV